MGKCLVTPDDIFITSENRFTKTLFFKRQREQGVAQLADLSSEAPRGGENSPAPKRPSRKSQRTFCNPRSTLGFLHFHAENEPSRPKGSLPTSSFSHMVFHREAKASDTSALSAPNKPRPLSSYKCHESPGEVFILHHGSRH